MRYQWKISDNFVFSLISDIRKEVREFQVNYENITKA